MRRILAILILGILLSQTAGGMAAYSSQIEIRGGFIVMEATVNGSPGHYILDTGAPGLILNNKYHGNAARTCEGQLHGINGSISASSVSSWYFHWNQFETRGSEALAIDLSYLEEAVDGKIDGLVGMDIFAGYYILIDYPSQMLQLWTTLPETLSQGPSVSFPLEMHDHVPMALVRHGQKSFRFALDSGSKSHLLDAHTLKTWENSVTQLHPIILIGADQKPLETMKIEASGLNAMGIALPPTQFVITDLSPLSRAAGIRLDGVLGQPLFSGRTILIDKDRKFLKIGPKIHDTTSDESMASIN